MGWLDPINGRSLDWLLGYEDASVAFLSRTLLLDLDPESAAGSELRRRVLGAHAVQKILDAQYPDGFWMAPGIGYSPKYKASVWQLIFLAQLGAQRCVQTERAVEWLFRDNQRTDGGFVAGKEAYHDVLCLNGNLVWALAVLGFAEDARARRATEWLADRAAATAFACRYNKELPCAWGAVKTLRALGATSDYPSPRATAAQQCAVELLVSRDPVKGDYPSRGTPAGWWSRLGFPLGYHSDALETATALAEAGCAGHSRVHRVREWVLSRQDADGRWAQENPLGKAWASFGPVGVPSPWVTIRALRLVKLTQRGDIA